MKRKLRKIIFLIIIFGLVAGMMPSASASAGTFRTTGDVNLRAEPSTDAEVLKVIYNSTNVEVLEHNPAGWSKVQAGGVTGFIRSDFLKFPIGNTPATFRTTDGVNLRSSASTDSNILSTVVAGTSVEVLEHNPAGWSKVRISGTNGFIRSDFLTRGGSGGGSASGSASGSTEPAIATLKTVGNGVNFRSSSTTESSVIRSLSANTSVEVLENLSNGWSKVRHNGTVGYIRSDLLTGGSTSAPATITLRTVGNGVNFRAGPSTSHEKIGTLAANTSVEVIEQANGWSHVRHNGTTGYIRSDLLTSASGTASSSEAAIATLRTVTGVNFRTGPSTDHDKITTIPVNTAVEVLENQANGWSRVRYNGTVGFIKSDLLGSGARTIELVDWTTAKNIVQNGVDMRVVDVRTGITFNLRSFAKSGHADVEPPTQADTDAILRSRNGVWAWAPRPVWVTIGDRTFAAALNGMPHDVSTIRNNGMNGHLCLHFNNTVTNSKSYQRNLNNAVVEAYDARPR